MLYEFRSRRRLIHNQSGSPAPSQHHDFSVVFVLLAFGRLVPRVSGTKPEDAVRNHPDEQRSNAGAKQDPILEFFLHDQELNMLCSMVALICEELTTGVEPATKALQEPCSTGLSYVSMKRRSPIPLSRGGVLFGYLIA